MAQIFLRRMIEYRVGLSIAFSFVKKLILYLIQNNAKNIKQIETTNLIKKNIWTATEYKVSIFCRRKKNKKLQPITSNLMNNEIATP